MPSRRRGREVLEILDLIELIALRIVLAILFFHGPTKCFTRLLVKPISL